jgi:hypothetical protein
LKERKIER